MTPTVIEVECHRFLEQSWTLEQIQEFCRQYQTMMEGFMPETMREVVARNNGYLYCEDVLVRWARIEARINPQPLEKPGLINRTISWFKQIYSRIV